MSGDRPQEPWQPVVADGERLDDVPLGEWVGQALGTASTCWANLRGAGEFDSVLCGWVLDGLMAHVNAVIDEARVCPPAGAGMPAGMREVPAEQASLLLVHRLACRCAWGADDGKLIDARCITGYLVAERGGGDGGG